MKGDDGKPLSADKVTFRGWRRGPWYALDGTNPEVQKHLETLFRKLRRSAADPQRELRDRLAWSVGRILQRIDPLPGDEADQ